MQTLTEGETALAEWVQEHKVTWELTPWTEMVDHQPVAVGFELRLLARHVPPDTSPGCGECVRVYQRLRELAGAAFPHEPRPASYEIEPFDASFHLRPETGWVPEVQLAVHIVHKDGYLRPADEGERRCAREIQQSLARLGVQAGHWSKGHGRAAGAA